MSDGAKLVLAALACGAGHLATWLTWRALIRRMRKDERLPPPPAVPHCICGKPLGFGRCPQCGA
jgi:hypothetical protein